MQIELVGEYEVTVVPGGEPALVIHHVIRGYDVVALGAADTAELGALLAVHQKRIRELGGYRVLLGAGGDVTLYAPTGARACYLNPEQAAQVARLIAAGQ
jgi:hypothetical protein